MELIIATDGIYFRKQRAASAMSALEILGRQG